MIIVLRVIAWVMAFCLAWLFEGHPAAWAATMPVVDIAASQTSKTTVSVPDFSKLSFSQLPPIASNGGVSDPTLNRSWQAGQTPDQFLNLGDIASLRPQDMTLQGVGQILGTDLNQASLGSFAPVASQNVNSLLQSAPALGQLRLNQLPPIQDLFGQRAAGIVGQALSGGTSLLQAVQQFPALGKLDMSAIDLQKFAIGTLPGLSQLPLGQFAGWDKTPINGVPGLNQVPMGAFPNPVGLLDGTAMRIDMVYGPAEAKRTNTISGSDVMGFRVPCTTSGTRGCAYIELDDSENSGSGQRGLLEGLQWISGKYQQVDGGSGALKLLNGGKEPTGRLPFGDVFKVVIWEPDEETDNVSTALFARFCNNLGCSPYFIGPIPFLTYKRDSNIFVGPLELGTPPNSTSTPTGATKGGAMPGIRTGGLPINTQCLLSQAQALSQTAAASGGGAVDLPKLANAIANVGSAPSQAAQSIGQAASQDGYQTVGAYNCVDGATDCGRELGRYKFTNADPYAAALITAKPGGQGFLDKLKGGYQPTAQELMQFFPPQDQDKAMQSKLQALTDRAKGEIDPTTNQPYIGDRLVERVAQMQAGGSAAPAAKNAVDSLGTGTPQAVGQQAATVYAQAQQSAAVAANPSAASPGAVPAGSSCAVDQQQDSQQCSVDVSKLDGATKAAIASMEAPPAKAAQMVPYIMQACAKAGITDLDQLSYVLATAQHETGYFRTMNEDSRTMYDSCGWGEGMIQVTYCDKKEFVFRKLGLPAYGGISDKRLTDPAIAAQALCRGLKEGWYGQMRPISQCIGGGKKDYMCAREQVNWHDRWQDIGASADRIKLGLVKGGGSAGSIGSAVTCTPAGGSIGGASAVAAGPANQRIFDSANQLYGLNTAQYGRNGCAYAVNEVLASAGFKRLGSNPNYVPSVEQDLRSGRGVQVFRSQSKAGDIIIAKGQEHIGICMSDGCTQVLSNSSTPKTFTWRSGSDFNGSYNNSSNLLGSPTEVFFRVKN